MTGNKMMGHRYDGGQSPLGGLAKGPTLATALRMGDDKDFVVMPSGASSDLGAVKRELMNECGITPEQYLAMSDAEQNAIITRLEKKMRKYRKQGADAGRKLDQMSAIAAHRDARTQLHISLQTWARGELKLERPQAASLHHMLRYDDETDGSTGDRESVHSPDMQSFIVENDWGRVVPMSHGEWRLPFKRICWEFRISGVRVLTFTMADDVESPVMFSVYGRDRMWVSDDYLYSISQNGIAGTSLYGDRRTITEFRKIATMVYANIRASCIMLDAKIAHGEAVTPSEELVRRARREGVPAPRKHHVVRLLRQQRSPNRNVHRTGTGMSGVHQRGHWRPGRWLHYDNQDSGSDKYVNDGGFYVSKSWQSWHFAGDPNNIIEKEYRL